jgi:NAD(P)-dependent dehydrogenase (short-subunit alcohol dehydrogenase family)
MLLADRVAIVTGGARGIGKGIASTFADEGASVVLADILEAEGKKTAEEIAEKGVKSLFVPCDVKDGRQIQHMVDRTINEFGQIDILVNNAGTGPFPVSVTELSEEEWDSIFALNMRSMFLCCKAVAPHMKEKRYGRIINISSLASISPYTSIPHYSASKGGINSFTIDVALELAPYNICVNAILPGMIRTDLAESLLPPDMDNDAFFAEYGKDNIPLCRAGTPEDIGGVALFLASWLSSYVTANKIIVSGGLPYNYGKKE